jgi:hypothetical protein
MAASLVCRRMFGAPQNANCTIEDTSVTSGAHPQKVKGHQIAILRIRCYGATAYGTRAREQNIVRSNAVTVELSCDAERHVIEFGFIEISPLNTTNVQNRDA